MDEDIIGILRYAFAPCQQNGLLVVFVLNLSHRSHLTILIGEARIIILLLNSHSNLNWKVSI